jgi:hypothetical protein
MKHLEAQNEENESEYQLLATELTKLKEYKLSDDERVTDYEIKLKETNVILEKFSNIEENLKISELRNKELMESQESLLKKILQLETDILAKQEALGTLNEELNTLRVDLKTEKDLLIQQLDNSKKELKLFEQNVSKELDEYKNLTKIISDYESNQNKLRQDNEVYLKCLNLIKEKLNFEDFMNEDLFMNKINQIIGIENELKLSKDEIERNGVLWNEEKQNILNEINRLNVDFDKFKQENVEKLADNQVSLVFLSIIIFF